MGGSGGQESNPSHVATAATISVAVMEGVGTALQSLDGPARYVCRVGHQVHMSHMGSYTES